MKTGLIHSSGRKMAVYSKLRRQIILEFKAELAQATGWKRDWIKWKRSMAVRMRYNEILFSGKGNYLVR